MHAVVIFVAQYFIVLSLIITFVVWLKLKTGQKKEFIILGIIAGIIALILAKIGGHLFYDTRPFVAGHFTPYFSHDTSNGFPSDHTLLTAFLAYLVSKYDRKIGIALFIIALLVGAARIIAGVHHLVDIIGSLVIAAIAVLLADYILKLATKKARK